MYNPNILFFFFFFFFVLLTVQAVAGNALTNDPYETPAGQATPYYFFPTWQRTPFDNTYGPRTSYPAGATYRTFQLTVRNNASNYTNTSPFYGTSFDDEISNTTTIRRDDLECKDYRPVGWTSNEARIWVHSDPGTYPECEGVNTCSCSPWQLADQVPRTPASNPKATGAIYTISHCNSSLFSRPSGLYLENTCFDAVGGRACHYNTLHNIQLKDRQGRCLTHEFYDAPETRMVWRPCDYDSYDHSQIYAVIEHVRCYTSNNTRPHGCGDSLPPRVYMFPRFTMAGEPRHWNFKFDIDDEQVLNVVEGDPLDTTLTVLLSPYAPMLKRNSWDRKFRPRRERPMQLD